ncbi:hypothetical protein SESBI_12506 [Sesbania bispinosa]|nr:hypothetical protein SESBI_12506 [Sesbania bispinosa]
MHHYYHEWNQQIVMELAQKSMTNLVQVNHELHQLSALPPQFPLSHPQLSTIPPPCPLNHSQFSSLSSPFPFSHNTSDEMMMELVTSHSILKLPACGTTGGVYNPYNHYMVGLNPTPPPSPEEEFDYYETRDFLSLMDKPLAPILTINASQFCTHDEQRLEVCARKKTYPCPITSITSTNTRACAYICSCINKFYTLTTFLCPCSSFYRERTDRARPRIEALGSLILMFSVDFT